MSRPAARSGTPCGIAFLWTACCAGKIPSLLAEQMAGFVLPGDEEAIRYPIDLLGINYYSRMTMKYETGHPFDVWWGDAHCDR